MDPEVSVVIPTMGRRPALLRRAVESALAGHAPGAVEVIVVPNGDEPSWRDSIAQVSVLTGVRIVPLARSNVSAARNTGLEAARGELLRFLDDDDFLYPEVAARQCRAMLASNAEICSGGVSVEDERGVRHALLHQPDEPDLVAAMLGRWRLPLPAAHLFRRALIGPVRWNEAYTVAEDIAWLIDLSVSRTWKWQREQDVVSCWYQHSGPRLTFAHAAHAPNRNTAEAILSATLCLAAAGALDERRRRAAASGLWTCAHRAFYLRPRYWATIARQALALDPLSRPASVLFKPGLRMTVDPVLMEWLVTPLRLLVLGERRLRDRLVGQRQVRNL